MGDLIGTAVSSPVCIQGMAWGGEEEGDKGEREGQRREEGEREGGKRGSPAGHTLQTRSHHPTPLPEPGPQPLQCTGGAHLSPAPPTKASPLPR